MMKRVVLCIFVIIAAANVFDGSCVSEERVYINVKIQESVQKGLEIFSTALLKTKRITALEELAKRLVWARDNLLIVSGSSTVVFRGKKFFVNSLELEEDQFMVIVFSGHKPHVSDDQNPVYYYERGAVYNHEQHALLINESNYRISRGRISLFPLVAEAVSAAAGIYDYAVKERSFAHEDRYEWLALSYIAYTTLSSLFEADFSQEWIRGIKASEWKVEEVLLNQNIDFFLQKTILSQTAIFKTQARLYTQLAFLFFTATSYGGSTWNDEVWQEGVERLKSEGTIFTSF